MTVIPRSDVFDLGLDHTRMREQADVDRQNLTVDRILARFFAPDPSTQWDMQILADEVGMGKTFVGLGVAYSILEAVRSGRAKPADLRGCQSKTIIITPTNSALFNKWNREVAAFVGRCVRPERQADASWFVARQIEHLDDLVAALIRDSPDTAPVLITNTGAFTRKLRSHPLKRRQLLGLLFARWRGGFGHGPRTRLLRNAESGWPSDSKAMLEFSDDERAALALTDAELRAGIESYLGTEQGAGAEADILGHCRSIVEPYRRNRDDIFAEIAKRLNQFYRATLAHVVGASVPLIIVDEAHNWKNGPSRQSNGYKWFESILAPRTRRLLLLTATPFQLRPAELLELIRIGGQLSPCATIEQTVVRRATLERHRDGVVKPVLKNASTSSRRFQRQWTNLPRRVSRDQLQEGWQAPRLLELRRELRSMAERAGALEPHEVESLIAETTADVDPDLRGFLREGLRLYSYNEDLSVELGYLVIRHRRPVGHRRCLIGEEFTQAAPLARPDAHVLHASRGLDVTGPGELPHYLLMRSVAQLQWDKGRKGARTSLGSALTGCYSTLLGSAEGRSLRKLLNGSPEGQLYFEMLTDMVSEAQDPEHPKVAAVIDAVVQAWDKGEKSLLFCFRTNTAKRLHEIISKRLDERMSERVTVCLGGEEGHRRFRSRLTNKNQDLIVLGLDRVLWSVLRSGLAWDGEAALTPAAFQFRGEDLEVVARLGLMFDQSLDTDRVDRVFLLRAIEYAMALRWQRELGPRGPWARLLEQVGSVDWVATPYGQVAAGSDDLDGSSDPDQHTSNERGVHSTYAVIDETPSPERIRDLANTLALRRARAGVRSVFEMYTSVPSLWLGLEPARDTHTDQVTRLHQQLRHLTGDSDPFDWTTRSAVMEALRRTVLRDAILLRLLPANSGRGDDGWGEILVRAFFAPLAGQRECMVDRINVYLEDIVSADGSVSDGKSLRFALLDSAKLRAAFVSLVTGETNTQSRDRVFTGFNTPLSPEVLVCTAVGQEGIDLHRHCRNVVHYDLPWNPALLEQRTGRVDRIGSKTFRERDFAAAGEATTLDIGVPFLAGTYDERIYEELRLRGQTFEVLTGGDVTADDNQQAEELEPDGGKEQGLSFVPLPDVMANDLRVKLSVFEAPEGRVERSAAPSPGSSPAATEQETTSSFVDRLADWYHADARRLGVESPWFGLFTLESGDTLTDFFVGCVADPTRPVLDWRDPLARGYYTDQPGESHDNDIVTRRVEVDGHDGQLEQAIVSVDGIVSTFQRDAQRAMAASDGRRRTTGSSGLPDIRSRLTPDQYRVVSAPRDKSLVLEGEVGSGKTTVGVYRLAWLAMDLDPEHMQIIVANRAMESWVRASLPPLGLGGAHVDTYSSWALRQVTRACAETVLPRVVHDPRARQVSDIKRDHGMLAAVDAFVDRQIERLKRWIAVKLQPYEARDWLETLEASNEPILRTLIMLRERTLEARDAADGREQQELDQIHRLFAKGIERMTQYKDELLLLMTDAELLGSHLTSIESVDPGILSVFQTELQQTEGTERRLGPFVGPEDLSILLRIIQRKNGGLPTATDHKRIEIYDQLLIDDAQDLGPVDLATLFGSVSSDRDVILIGDETWGASFTAATVELGSTQRSSRPIMHLAGSIIGEELTSDWGGEKPSLTYTHDIQETADRVGLLIRRYIEDAPQVHIAVILPTPRDAQSLEPLLQTVLAATGFPVRLGHDREFEFGRGVTVTDLHQVGGVEFDMVVIVNPTELAYPVNEVGQRDLYTVVTRARQQLDILCMGAPTPLLTPSREQGLIAEQASKEVPEIEFDDEDDAPF